MTAGIGWPVYGDTVGAWERRSARQASAVGVSAAVYPSHLDAAVARGLRTGSGIGAPGSLVRVGPLNLFTDGSLNTRTALCRDPYPGLLSPEDLPRFAELGVTAGVQPRHATDDRDVADRYWPGVPAAPSRTPTCWPPGRGRSSARTPPSHRSTPGSRSRRPSPAPTTTAPTTTAPPGTRNSACRYGPY
ncbi:hypothetical protein [Streptomyces hyaluromycini]|uniref:hypothetical protein n=1 Tax=Streptomyces hyaluromycini TaxID=1377993 RepID=UPI003D9E7940